MGSLLACHCLSCWSRLPFIFQINNKCSFHLERWRRDKKRLRKQKDWITTYSWCIVHEIKESTKDMNCHNRSVHSRDAINIGFFFMYIWLQKWYDTAAYIAMEDIKRLNVAVTFLERKNRTTTNTFGKITIFTRKKWTQFCIRVLYMATFFTLK